MPSEEKVMSEVRVNLCETETGTCDDQVGPSPDEEKSPSRPDLQG